MENLELKRLNEQLILVKEIIDGKQIIIEDLKKTKPIQKSKWILKFYYVFNRGKYERYITICKKYDKIIKNSQYIIFYTEKLKENIINNILKENIAIQLGNSIYQEPTKHDFEF